MRKVLIILVMFIGLLQLNIYAQNQVLSLDGEGAFMDSNLLYSNSHVTFELWAKSNIECDVRVILFGIHNPQDDGRFYFGYETGDGFLGLGLGNSRWNNEGNNFLLDTNWHHYVLIWNEPNMQLFIDGELKAEKINTTNATNTYYIGAANVGYSPFSDSYFTGFIDEVRIWNYNRTQQEIDENMFQILEGNETGLISYWNYNNGTANDLTSNENNGTLHGDALIIEEVIPGFGFLNANFISPEIAYIGEPIQLADTSSGYPTIWEWDFENDGIYDSTYYSSQDTIYWTYENEGTYSVKLKISNGTFADSLTKEITVEYCPPASPDSIQINLNYPDATISWTEVDTTDCGSVITPDGYVILYNETAYEDEKFYYFLDFTTELSYIHTFVAEYRDQMFYNIVAIKNFDREQIEYLVNLNNSREKIKWVDVKRNLDKLRE